MPRNTRDWAKRKLEMAIGNLDWAGSHLLEVIEVYQEHHPEVSEPLVIICQSLIEIQGLISKVRESF